MLHNLFLSSMNRMSKLCLIRIFVIAMLAAGTVAGQSSFANVDDEDTQSWNEFQLSVPLAKQISFTTRVTMRVGGNIRRLTEGRQSFGLSWRPVSALTLAPSYSYIRTRSSSGIFRKEDRYALAATYQFPFKVVGLSHRSQYEKRQRSSGDTWRYRAGVTLKKDLPKTWAKSTSAYVTNEVFYDSAAARFSRNRFSVGLERSFTRSFSAEVYYLRQNDGVSRPGDLHIIGFGSRYRL